MEALSLEELDTGLIEKWKQLDLDTEVANPFLSCGFVCSFLKNRRLHQEPVFLVCRCNQSDRLIGLGVFQHVKGTTSLPLPHLLPFRCEHALRNGFLIARGATSAFCSSLLDYMNHQRDWFGIEFPGLRLEQQWVRRLQELSSTGVPGCSFNLRPISHSPVVEMHTLREKDLEANWSPSRRKSIRRNQKRLEKYGNVDFQLISSENEMPAALERFLLVENSGWKKEGGTSLSSHQEDRAFIEEMVAELSTQQRVVISELRVGNNIAASAINLISGREMFAFKIGYNEDYAEAGPGILHEVHLARYVAQNMPQLTRIDGCAKADSYLSQIWPDRIAIGEGLLLVSKWAQGTAQLVSTFRQMKHWAISLLEKKPQQEKSS